MNEKCWNNEECNYSGSAVFPHGREIVKSLLAARSIKPCRSLEGKKNQTLHVHKVRKTFLSNSIEHDEKSLLDRELIPKRRNVTLSAHTCNSFTLENSSTIDFSLKITRVNLYLTARHWPHHEIHARITKCRRRRRQLRPLSTTKTESFELWKNQRECLWLLFNVITQLRKR